eukprot:2792485-Pyramimonas_sp.AAC.1
MRAYAHIAERTLAILVVSLVTVTEPRLHVETNAGQPANNVRNDDPQSTETTTLLAQIGGTASGSQDTWARPGGPPDAVSPMQAMTLMGSAGQPAESDLRATSSM